MELPERRNDIMAVLLWLELAALEVDVTHASVNSCAAQHAKGAEWTAARVERTKRSRFQRDMPDCVALQFVPCAVAMETCVYMGRGQYGS